MDHESDIGTFNFNQKPPPAVPAKPGKGDIVEFVRQKLGLDPDERQQEVLRSQAKRGILNCTRQWGNRPSRPPRRCIAPTRGPTAWCWWRVPASDRAASFCARRRNRRHTWEFSPRGDGHNDLSLLFPNWSRIVGLPGMEATTRGFSAVSLLLIDEASRVDDSLYKALRPMLAVGRGDLWLLSTPWGKRGFFYEAWENGGPAWARFRVPATECPRILPEFLEEETQALGSLCVRQEYLCEFLDNGSNVFERDLVEGALDDELEPLMVRPG